jgi:hypothetical protein
LLLLKGRELKQDVSRGILFTNYSLVMQKMDRKEGNLFNTAMFAP